MPTLSRRPHILIIYNRVPVKLDCADFKLPILRLLQAHFSCLQLQPDLVGVVADQVLVLEKVLNQLSACGLG